MTLHEERAPGVAGQFYPGSAAAVEMEIRSCLAGASPPEDLGPVVGGVVPHAGWTFSGPTAAKVFRAIAERANPDTFVLLGAVHSWGVRKASAFPAGAWKTPMGKVAVDGELVEAIVEAAGGRIDVSANAHQGEHSIEVQVPFIQSLCPHARIVPIAVPPASDNLSVGEAIATGIRESGVKAVVVGTSDLTHYGLGYGAQGHGRISDAMGWMRDNDRRMIGLIESLSVDKIVPEAEANQNACGAGAIAAALAAARALGATAARVLEYTTSADVLGERNPDRAVGYAGIVFEAGLAQTN